MHINIVLPLSPNQRPLPHFPTNMHNLMMMLTLLIQVFVVIHLFSGTYGFCQSSPSCFGKHGKHLGTAASLTQLKPVGGDGVIPRLEPGLRFVQSRANFLVQMQEKKVTISKFSLNCLSKYAPETIAPPAGSDVINSVFNTASKVSSFLSRYARKGLALTAVVVSLGAFPRNVLARGHTPLKTATMIGTAFLAAADLATAAPTRPLTLTPPKPSSGAVELANSLNPLRLWDRISSSFNQNIGIVKENFNIDMNLMKWKNYDTLTASQRLGTTPVYFVANARGSSYIQNDAKVSLLNCALREFSCCDCDIMYELIFFITCSLFSSHIHTSNRPEILTRRSSRTSWATTMPPECYRK